MNEGEKYLDIKIVGHEFIRAFPNKERTGNQPHYKADGIAVWVKTVKPKNPTTTEEQI